MQNWIEGETGFVPGAAVPSAYAMPAQGAMQSWGSDCVDRGTCVVGARVGAFGQIREDVEGACLGAVDVVLVPGG